MSATRPRCQAPEPAGFLHVVGRYARLHPPVADAQGRHAARRRLRAQVLYGAGRRERLPGEPITVLVALGIALIAGALVEVGAQLQARRTSDGGVRAGSTWWQPSPPRPPAHSLKLASDGVVVWPRHWLLGPRPVDPWPSREAGARVLRDWSGRGGPSRRLLKASSVSTDCTMVAGTLIIWGYSSSELQQY